MDSKQGSGSVTASVATKNGPDYGEKVRNDLFLVPDFEGPAAEVGFEIGVTLNLGNYESARVAVSVKIPCSPGNVEPTFDKAKAWVEQQMEVQIKEIRSTRGV